MKGAIQVSRESLRELLNDDAHESRQIAELQERLTRYELEARDLRGDVRRLTAENAELGVANWALRTQAERLDRLVTDLLVSSKMTVKQVALAFLKAGLEPAFTSRKKEK
jgi:predicted  nucleic acid-binding Zn-ribbon protein